MIRRYKICVWVLSLMLMVMGMYSAPQRAWAEYEVDTDTVDTGQVPLGSQPFQWNWQENGDVQISWNATVGTLASNDNLLNFYYKWSDNNSTLTNDLLSSENYDGEIDASTSPYAPAIANSTLFHARGLDDENALAYLHVKTYYSDASNGFSNELSNDVVIGPINMDNVAPSGSVQVVDGQGNSITSTGETTLQLALSASVNPQYYYIQEDATPRPAQGVDRYTYNSTVDYKLLYTTPGSKTLYVWFEDAAGNISETPATVDFELLGSAYISPNEATIDISKSATKDFYVEGGSGGYDWSVINETPETENATVAQITTNATNATTITLEGLNPGTCQLQANGTNGLLTSGVITVKQGFAKGDANGDGDVNIFDGVVFVNYLLGKLTIDSIKGNFDLNGDGHVDIFDGVRFVNYLLGKNTL